MNNLKILAMNANSISGKLNVIRCYVATYKPSIVSICETKICDKFDDNELLGNEFTVWRKDRCQGAGGVLIAVRNDIDAKILKSHSGPGESITITLQIHDKIIFNIVTFYRPPGEYELDNLKEMIELYGEANNSILLGDFNLPDIEWSLDPPKGKVKASSCRKALHQRALDYFVEADLAQLVDKPTHKHGNTLDLVLVNNALLNEITCQCTILPPISDHNMILVDINVQKFSISRAPVYANKRFNFKKVKYDTVEEHYSELEDRLTQCQNNDEMWKDFYTTTDTVMDSLPTILPKPNGQPWITRQIARKVRKRGRLFTRNENYPSIKHQDELDEYSSALEREIKKAKSDYLKNHLTQQLEDGNSKPLYNYLKKNSGRSNNIAGLKDTRTEDIPDTLADHFANVYQCQDLPTPTLDSKAYPKMEAVHISESGLKQLIMKLDVKKAHGPDNLSSMLIKSFTENVPSFLRCLLILMSSTLQHSASPEAWKKAVVCPAFKGGDRSDINNYRPISLTCVLCKLLEHIICSQMWKHIDDYGIIDKNQHGFRKSLNTTTQLLHVTHKAAEALDKKRDYHIVSFDFSKAFDRVPHNLLLFKLRKYNFDERCVSWVQDWLRNRVSRVTVNGHLSKEFEVRSGVPQGSVLGPLLFLIYINDIHHNVLHSECSLYADDTLLSCDVAGDISSLQSDIDVLFEWSVAWGMLFNPRKCVHVQIGKDAPDNNVTLGNETIPTSDSFKYLGVIIQSDLKWNSHITCITGKANRSLGILRRSLAEAPVKTKLTAYKTIVRPILEYATPVWSPHYVGLINTVDKVQRRAVRWIYYLKKYDSVSECMNRNHIVSLHDRRDELDILFLRRVEAGLYDISLNTYIRFTSGHNTRGKVISWQHNINQWRYSYYNRIRGEIKVYFED